MHDRTLSEVKKYFDDCRADALNFLEIFLEAAPAEAKQTYMHMALQHFAELLSPSRRSNTVSAKSATSMLKASSVPNDCSVKHAHRNHQSHKPALLPPPICC